MVDSFQEFSYSTIRLYLCVAELKFCAREFRGIPYYNKNRFLVGIFVLRPPYLYSFSFRGSILSSSTKKLRHSSCHCKMTHHHGWKPQRTLHNAKIFDQNTFRSHKSFHYTHSNRQHLNTLLDLRIFWHYWNKHRLSARTIRPKFYPYP